VDCCLKDAYLLILLFILIFGAKFVEMANAESASRWYCHTCQSETKPTLPDFVCSQCQDGFIEPLDENAATSGAELQRSSSSGHSTQTEATAARVPQPGQGFSAAPRRAHITIHHVQQGSLVGPNPFQEFVTQVVGSLLGGAVAPQGASVNIQFAPWMSPNFGDYVVTAGGLDNVITMLLNQLDGGGPPPAPKDKIDALPTVVIIQEHVDSCLQCHICMEEFKLDEKVRGLPCKHIYHGECIVQWLELHGTCPMCRQRIDGGSGPEQPPQSQPPPPPDRSAWHQHTRPRPPTDIPPD
jgi:E3 ubiquitin-protein ligase RNF115/126